MLLFNNREVKSIIMLGRQYLVVFQSFTIISYKKTSESCIWCYSTSTKCVTFHEYHYSLVLFQGVMGNITLEAIPKSDWPFGWG